MREWPRDWEERKRGAGCPMCAQGRVEEDRFGVRVFAGTVADAYLQRADVGQRGYTVVIWRGRHVADVTELAPDEAAVYLAEVLRVARALERHYRPAKMNVALLGNEIPHLHAHLVPRYAHDGSPGRPPRFLREELPHATVPEGELAADAAALRAIV